LTISCAYAVIILSNYYSFLAISEMMLEASQIIARGCVITGFSEWIPMGQPFFLMEPYQICQASEVLFALLAKPTLWGRV